MILELTVECLTHRQLDILTQDISLAHTRPLAALYRLKLVRSIWRDAIGSRYGSALEVARRISHLGPQHVHDQQFTGRDASRRLRELALLCRSLGGARSSCMGGRLSGNGRRSRRRGWGVGAHVIVEVLQAAGTIPLDVHGLGVDFAVGGVLKWLCGGPGVAYLYVREDLRAKLRPTLTGWIAHRRPFAFETGGIDPREDSFRYLNGTPHIPALYACQSGFDILNKVGIAAIREKSKRMTPRIVEGASTRGWRGDQPGKAAD